MGGYFFGKIIGGKKITKISPNKTYSGMCGSFIFSTFPILFLHFLDYKFFRHEFLVLSFKTLLLSLLFSVVCQLGDIAVSYFKRKNKIKDSGKLLPGHGGLLDRIDGIIFVLILSSILKILKII
jgi:phosphatidate cytidylyltransferase